MKKVLCKLGLIIGGIALPLAFAYFTTVFTFIIFPISLLFDIVLLICFVICMTYILKLLINKAKINVKKIVIYFEIPCAVLSVLALIVVKYWINNNYFGDGMLAGLAEYIFSVLLLICSLSTIVITIILRK